MTKMEKETRLKLAICLSLIFMCIEIAGGYMANSIAIFSDAAHLLTDIAGFIIALIATIAAKAPGTKHLTFGMARAEVFGALASVMSLWVITAFLLYAAFFRAVAWFEDRADPVDGFLMFVVACFGVVVNLCLGYVFQEDHGGAFHPGHSHEHGHSCGGHGHGGDDHGHSKKASESYQQVDMVDLEKNSKKAPAKVNDHGHEHGHGHEHNHNEKTPLLAGSHKAADAKSAKAEPFAFAKAAKCTGHAHDESSHKYTEEPAGHGHDHGHSHGHDHSSHADHDHADRDIEAKGCGGHDHSHGHVGHADSHDDHSTAGHGHNAHSSDVNMQAAYLHVMTDLIQSVGVAIAGAVLWWKPHWQIIDPICTVLFSIVALKSTLPLINRVGLILFEGTPAHVDWEVVMTRFQAIPGVEDVHDLHIWSISSDSISLTCHIRALKPQEVLLAAHKICRKLGIDHATIQVHDAQDSRFCYSETCDDEADLPKTASGSTKKKKACV